MGCGHTLVKCILFGANVLFALAGLVLAGLGVAVLVSLHRDGFQGLEVDAVPIAAIVVGVVAFVVAFFGCCGAIMESKVMLAIYSVLLIILMNVKAALAAVLFVGASSLTTAVQTEIKKTFAAFFSGVSSGQDFHDIEDFLDCCGLEGPQSYFGRSLPATCCADKHDCTDRNSYNGCLPIAEEAVLACCFGAGILCLILVAIELLAVIFGLCLANHVGNKYKGRY